MQNETMEITLPVELVRQIRERVRAGEFSNESEVIIDILRRHDESPHSDEEVEQFIQQHVLPALEYHDRNPSSALSSDQMHGALTLHHQERLRTRELVRA